MSRVTGDLSEDIRGVIEHYLDGHRTRSLATLSRTSGVSYTTLRRLYQREGNPTAEPVLKIVDSTLNNDKKIEFLNRHYPEIANAVNVERKTYAPEAERDESLKTFLFREPHNFILNLAHTDMGTTREDVRRLNGERGVEALDELLENDLLTQEYVGKQQVLKRPPSLSQDCDIAINQIKLSADHFDRSLTGTKAARIFHTTGSVSQRALEEIHDILSDAIRAVLKVKNDPRSAGNVPMFSAMMMNVYDKAALKPGRDET